MTKDISKMTTNELTEYANQEAVKAGFRFITLESNLPLDYIIAAKYIRDNLNNCDYFKKDKYQIAFIEEYIPMMGMIWRIIIFDINKAKQKLEETTNENNSISIKRIIGGSQVLSIYYDSNDVLGIMGQPYFEIYDGNDTERFFGHEYKELYNCIEDTLSRIIH